MTLESYFIVISNEHLASGFYDNMKNDVKELVLRIDIYYPPSWTCER